MNYSPYQPGIYQTPGFGPYVPPSDVSGAGGYSPTPPAQTPAQPNQGPIMGLSPASRPVTSKEEAMGVAADFSGALMMFPDITHNRVYVKRWDLNSGGPAFQEYAPVVPPAVEQEQPKQPDIMWASLQDVQDLKEVVERLQKELNQMKKPVGRTGKSNDAADK